MLQIMDYGLWIIHVTLSDTGVALEQFYDFKTNVTS